MRPDGYACNWLIITCIAYGLKGEVVFGRFLSLLEEDCFVAWYYTLFCFYSLFDSKVTFKRYLRIVFPFFLGEQSFRWWFVYHWTIKKWLNIRKLQLNQVIRSLRFKVLKTIQTVYRNELRSNPNGKPYNLNILTPYNLTSWALVKLEKVLWSQP